MLIFAIDLEADTRQELVSRLRSALAHAGFRRPQLTPGGRELLNAPPGSGSPDLIFLGPGCYAELAEMLVRIRQRFPHATPISVLSSDVYAHEAVDLSRQLRIRVVPLPDVAQFVQVLSDFRGSPTAPASSQGVSVMVAQCKGGVGATTTALSLATIWGGHGRRTVVVDLDDANPHLSDWARAPVHTREVVGEFIRAGNVPSHRINEILVGASPEGEQIVHIVPQPELFREAFHLKADVLEDAPSSAVYINSLREVLTSQFDIVVFDAGRTWGISALALLPKVDIVALVFDDDRSSLVRTVENLRRLSRESDDPSEFEFSRWRLVLNAYTGAVLTDEDVRNLFSDLDLFAESLAISHVPYCDYGRDWTMRSTSFYETASPETRAALEHLAYSLVPFELDTPERESTRSIRSSLMSFLRGH